MSNYDDSAIQIINKYLNTYNLNMYSLDFIVKNILVDYSIVRETVIDGIQFKFTDGLLSNTVPIVTSEINEGDTYDFSSIDFQPGDTVIDIGGNIGMVSIYLAKKYPFLKIYAYEPMRQNYESFVKNIKLNNIPENTIFVENKAVTSDGRNVNMSVNILNSGGSSISDVVSVGAVTQEMNCNIESITLENIFKEHNIEHLKLLKIDCEGSEYEILYNTSQKYLEQIDIVRGEFHENKSLTDEYDVEKLLEYITKYVPNTKVVPAKGCFIM